MQRRVVFRLEIGISWMGNEVVPICTLFTKINEDAVDEPDAVIEDACCQFNLLTHSSVSTQMNLFQPELHGQHRSSVLLQVFAKCPGSRHFKQKGFGITDLALA